MFETKDEKRVLPREGKFLGSKVLIHQLIFKFFMT